MIDFSFSSCFANMAEGCEGFSGVPMDVDKKQEEAEVITIEDDDDHDDQVTIEALRSAGNTHYSLQDYDEALKLYTAAIEIAPNQPATALCYGNRAACYVSIGKYKEALEDTVIALKLDPTYSKGLSRMLRCKTMLCDWMGCHQLISEHEDTVVDPLFVNEMERFYTILRHKTEGDKSYDKGEYRTTIYYMDQLMQMGITATECKTLKAECLALLGRYNEAQDLANSILYHDKTNVEASYVRGICLYYEFNIDKAFMEFQRIVKLAPDFQKVKPVFKLVKSMKLKREEGNKAYKAGCYDEAYKRYTEALQIDPKNVPANATLYYNRATVLAKLGRLTESISDCTSALRLDSTYLKALARRGQCHRDLENFEDAVNDFETLHKMDPSREHLILLQEAKIELKKSQTKDYYKILGILKTASVEEIRRAYKKKALEHHPDRHSSSSDDVKKENEKLFKELQEAYEVLSDPKRKYQYDRGPMSDFQYCESPHMYQNFNFHFN